MVGVCVSVGVGVSLYTGGVRVGRRVPVLVGTRVSVIVVVGGISVSVGVRVGSSQGISPSGFWIKNKPRVARSNIPAPKPINTIKVLSLVFFFCMFI